MVSEPECLLPLEADPGIGGKHSDQLTVVMAPIDVINNKPARSKRQVMTHEALVIGLD